MHTQHLKNLQLLWVILFRQLIGSTRICCCLQHLINKIKACLCFSASTATINSSIYPELIVLMKIEICWAANDLLGWKVVRNKQFWQDSQNTGCLPNKIHPSVVLLFIAYFYAMLTLSEKYRIQDLCLSDSHLRVGRCYCSIQNFLYHQRACEFSNCRPPWFFVLFANFCRSIS